MSPTMRHHGKALMVMLIGDPGTGKTGSIAEVANHMDEFGIERIIIQDWDKGVDILSNFLKPEMIDQVFYATFRDKFKPTEQGAIIDPSRMALQSGMKMLNRWKEGKEEDGTLIDLGNANSWGEETLFVCDSLTGLGDACINWQRHLDNADVSASDWSYTGGAMNRQDKYIQMLLSMKCHRIVTSHIRFMGGGGTVVTTDKKGSNFKKEVDSRTDGVGYPSALGQKLPPEIGRHFNNILEYKLVGKARKIRTVVDGNIRLKTSVPDKLRDEYGISTGLYEFFKAVLVK